MKNGLHVGNNPDGSRIEASFDVVAAARTAELQAEIRAHVDALVSPDQREMLMADLLKQARGLPVSPQRIAMALAVEAFTDRARVEAERVAAACAACNMAEELSFVWIDLSAIGVP